MTETPQSDVVLVCMPVAPLEHPSLAIGQLTACLKRDAVSVRGIYANLMFLDYIGSEDHILIDSTRIEDSLGDWLFAGVAFPEFEPDHARYLARLVERNPRFGGLVGDDAEARLWRLRDSMAGFVDWVADKVIAANPRIVGATSTFQQHVASLALLRRLRERAPDIVTMLGGANCETVMGRTTHRSFPWVDYLASGEADGFFGSLCRSVLEHGRDVAADDLPYGVNAPVHRVTGYPETSVGDGVPRATTDDMSTVPVPDYDDYFAELSRSMFSPYIQPGIPFESARGCWWGERRHCIFCGLNGGGMTFRAKPPEQVIGDLDHLAERYGIRRFEAVDNIMATDYLDTLAPALTDSGRDYLLFYETKANLRPADIERMTKAGIRWIQPGIENLHTDVLKLMRKGVTGWNNVRLLRACRQYGMRLAWTILAGFPGEDDAWYDEMADWLPSLHHLQPGGIIKLRYDRYSPYHEERDTNGLDLVPSELYRYVYPLDEAALAEQVYFFEDTADEDRRVNLIVGDDPVRPGLSRVRNAIVEWRKIWRQDEVPILRLDGEAGAWSITDTRAVATTSSYTLDDDAAALLLASDDAPPRHRLVDGFAREGWPQARIEAALATLIERRLVLAIDERIVNLALRDPVGEMTPRHLFPGGWISWKAHPPVQAQAAE